MPDYWYEHNWDDEGAEAILMTTYQRAKDCADQLFSGLPGNVRVTPCSEGTVDIMYRSRFHDFLINIPANGYGAYYGANHNRTFTIKGQINPESDNDWLRQWIQDTP